MKAFLHPNRILKPYLAPFLHDQDPKRTLDLFSGGKDDYPS
jgi:hypothetical protein